MMKSEFIEKTGFEPTEAEYRGIEAEYMGCDIGKDEFCKTWKKQGGVQRLMRLRARRIEELEAELASEKNVYIKMDSQHRDTIRELEESANIWRWRNGKSIFQHQRECGQDGSQYDVVQRLRGRKQDGRVQGEG